MTGIFVAIANSWREPGALIVVGQATLDDEVSPIQAQSVSQMDGPQYAGEVEKMTVANGNLALRARITDAVAAKKVAAGVYRGFGVVTAAGEIQRVALVDHPSVIGKSSARPALLKLGKGTAMQKDYAAADVALAAAERRLVELRPADAKEAALRLDMLRRVNHTREKLVTSGGMGVDLGPPGHGRGDAAALSVVRAALAQPMNTGTFLRFLNRYADR